MWLIIEVVFQLPDTNGCIMFDSSVSVSERIKCRCWQINILLLVDLVSFPG